MSMAQGWVFAPPLHDNDMFGLKPYNVPEYAAAFAVGAPVSAAPHVAVVAPLVNAT